MNFDIAISLGETCLCRYQISRILYQRDHNSLDGFMLWDGYNTSNDFGTHFFDWCVTPIPSLIDIIHSDFKDVLLFDNLEVFQHEDGDDMVRDTKTNLLYPHSFIHQEIGQLTKEELEKVYPEIKSKFDFLVKKTRKLLASDLNILFVITGTPAEESLLQLLATLAEKDFSFSLLYAPCIEHGYTGVSEKLKSHPNLIIRPIHFAPYPGDNASWDKALEDITFSKKYIKDRSQQTAPWEKTSEVNGSVLTPPTNENIQYFGRVDSSSTYSVKWDWPGVYLEAKFEGTSLGISLEDTENFYDIIIDGKEPFTLATKPGLQHYILAEDLTDSVHHVRIAKRSESNWHVASFYGFYLDKGKALLPPSEKPTRKIEFIGDSYTVGYGNEIPEHLNDNQDEIGQTITKEQLLQYTNTNKAFGPITAKHFNAQYHVNAFSGLGMVRNFDGSTEYAPFLEYYGATLNSQRETLPWDFSQWQPDLVVLGLGINDFSTQPGADPEAFCTTYHSFLDNIRSRYPNVQIICTAIYLSEEDKMCTYVQKVVQSQKDTGYQDVHYLEYDKDSFGSGAHPETTSHQKISEFLIQKINEIMPWSLDSENNSK